METETIITPGAFVLTPENYYSDEANKRYMSNSLFKAIYGHPGDPHPCQARALFGDRIETQALLIGSYVDAFFEGPQAFEDFCNEHKEQLWKKSGKEKYQFVLDADKAIERVKKDDIFMSYMGGNHQTVMVGVIAGQPFKIKMDAYHPGDKIVDLKYVKSSAVAWNPVFKRHVTFIEDYGYVIQGAVYQEVEYQNSGKRLPFYIAFITKDSTPDFGVVEIPQSMLDEALEFVKIHLTAAPYSAIVANPKACGRRSCPYCLDLKKLKGAISYQEFELYAAS